MNKLILKPINKAKLSKILISIAVISVMLAILLYPDRYILASLNGLKLWCFSVLPSLLPFFFLTALLTKTEVLCNVFCKTNKLTKTLFNLNGVSFYAFILSALSGYPVGSRTVNDLYLAGAINENEAKKTSILASTSGPLFIVGAVGTAMFNNKYYGFILYSVHLISAILTAITFRGKTNNSTTKNQIILNEKTDNILYESIYGSVISVLIVGGLITIFYVITEVLLDFKILTPLINLVNALFKNFNNSNVGEGFICGLIECTKGCYLLSKLPTTPLTLSLSAFLISFGGFSIIVQSLVYLVKAKVKPLFFILGKTIHAVYSFILSFIIFSII